MRLLGLIGALVMMEVGWLAIWPFSVVLTHSPAFTQAMHARFSFIEASPLTAPLGDERYIGPATALGVTFLAVGAAYVVAVLLVSRLRVPLLVIVGAAVVFQLTLATLPGLFSQDVFSYIAYGRLSVTYDLNPYIWPPSAVAKDPVLAWVADVWRSYPAPYGPLWLDVQWLMARLFGALSIVDQALAYRALANVLLLVNLAIVWRLLRDRTAAERGAALAALAWNPLVLFELAANAHNDVLMVTFSLVAVLALKSARQTTAVAGFALGALVKYLSALGMAWVAVAEIARDAPWRSRVARLIAFGAVTLVIVLLTAWPWLELPDSLEPLVNETANVGYVNAIPDNLVVALANAAQVPAELARGLERVLIVGVFAAYLLWEARQVLGAPSSEARQVLGAPSSDARQVLGAPSSDVETTLRATTRSLLVYILLVSTSVQTWYLCLPVALAAVLGWRSGTARVAIAYSLLALPALYIRYYLRELTPVWIDVLYGGLPVAWLIVARFRARTPALPLSTHEDHAHPQRHRLPGAIVEQLRR